MFQHNAWDNVEWGEEQEREAQEAVDMVAGVRVEHHMATQYEEKAADFWDKFYSIHQNRFFKERNWLFTEFPDLAPGYKGAVRVFDKDSDNTEHCENSDIPKYCDTLNQSEVDKLRESESYFGEKSNFRLLEIGCGTGSTGLNCVRNNVESDVVN